MRTREILFVRDANPQFARFFGLQYRPGKETAKELGVDRRTVQRYVKSLEELGVPLDAAVLMDVDFDNLMKRLTGRRTCSRTGKLLNIYFSPREEIDECLQAGGELIQREDDNEETIRSRLDVYREQTEPVIEYYRTRGKLKTIDADGTIDAIYERLKQAL